jgi:hypothetical protein
MVNQAAVLPRQPENPNFLKTHPCITVPPVHDMASKPLPFTLRNAMRIALMSAIPAYAQMLIPLSPWAVLVHLFVVGTTFVSIAHFSGGTMSHFLALEIVYGLFICVVPAWGRHFLRMTWFGCNIDGWRAHIVYCVFVARKLTYFLPTNYGSDVEVRGLGSILFQTCLSTNPRDWVGIASRVRSCLPLFSDQRWHIHWLVGLFRFMVGEIHLE